MSKKLLALAACIAVCGCTSISVPKSPLFPGISYDNRIFNKEFGEIFISTTVTGTNGASTNLVIRIGGWKSEAKYIADAIIQGVAIGAGLAQKAAVP